MRGSCSFLPSPATLGSSFPYPFKPKSVFSGKGDTEGLRPDRGHWHRRGCELQERKKWVCCVLKAEAPWLSFPTGPENNPARSLPPGGRFEKTSPGNLRSHKERPKALHTHTHIHTHTHTHTHTTVNSPGTDNMCVCQERTITNVNIVTSSES